MIKNNMSNLDYQFIKITLGPNFLCASGEKEDNIPPSYNIVIQSTTVYPTRLPFTHPIVKVQIKFVTLKCKKLVQIEIYLLQ